MNLDKIYTPENCRMVWEWLQENQDDGWNPDYKAKILKEHAGHAQLIRDKLTEEELIICQVLDAGMLGNSVIQLTYFSIKNPPIGDFETFENMLPSNEWDVKADPTGCHTIFMLVVKMLKERDKGVE